MAKSKPTLNLVSKTGASSSIVRSPNASNRPGILSACSQKGLILQESTGKPVARETQIKMTQRPVHKCGKKMRSGTKYEETRCNKNETGSSEFSWMSSVRGDSWRPWRKTQNPSMVTTQCGSILERATEIWSQTGRHDGFSVNTSIWGIFTSATLQAAVHLGNDYVESFYSTNSKPKRTWKQLFNVTGKLIKEHKEIQGFSVIHWH